MKAIAIALLCTGLLCGQQGGTPEPAPAWPSYLVFAGAGYTRNVSTPSVREGWVSGLIGVGAGVYSKTTLDMTGITTLRTGFCKVFRQTGNWNVGSCVDAGVQAAAPTIGSFAGGAFVTYNLGGLWKRLQGVEVLGEMRITGAAGSSTTTTATTSATGQLTTTTTTTGPATNQVTPGFFVGIGRAF